MSSSEDIRHRCQICHRPHALRFCRGFIAMNPGQRDDVVRAHGYCRNCLARSHTTGFCDSANSCRICHLGHHTMLHPLQPHTHQRPPATHGRKHSPVRPPTHARRPNNHQRGQNRSKTGITHSTRTVGIVQRSRSEGQNRTQQPLHKATTAERANSKQVGQRFRSEGGTKQE